MGIRLWTVFGLSMGLFGTAWGHLDSLKMNGVLVATKASSIAGNQSFNFGQVVTVTYLIITEHPAVNYLKHSLNGGVGNYTIDTSRTVSGTTKGLQTFMWKVPSTATTQGKIKIYQMFNNNPEKATSDNYNLVSGVFNIQSGLPILTMESINKFKLRQYNGSIWLSFAGSSAMGKAELCGLNGTVLRSVFIPGNHLSSVTIPTVGLPTGKAIVRLMVEGKSVQNQLVMIRP